MKIRKKYSYAVIGCALLVIQSNVLHSGESDAPVSSLRQYAILYNLAKRDDYVVCEKISGKNIVITRTKGSRVEHFCAPEVIELTYTSPGPMKYYTAKADWWRTWNPPSRLLRYALDFNWNDPQQFKELKMYVLKYAVLGFAAWYIIAIIKSYFQRQKKQQELQQLVILFKSIEASRNQESKSLSEASELVVAKDV